MSYKVPYIIDKKTIIDIIIKIIFWGNRVMSKRFKEGRTKGGIIFKILLAIVVLPIVICSLMVLVKGILFPDKIPDIFGYKPLIVVSNSMENYISKGDLVIVKMVGKNDLQKQDIIAYRLEGQNYVVTHRIFDIKEEDGQIKYQTKGDNNVTPDGDLIKFNEVEGKYVTKISKLGNFLLFMQDPKGLVIMLLVVLVIGLIWINAAKDDDDTRRKNNRNDFEEDSNSKRYTRANDDRFEVNERKPKH